MVKNEYASQVGNASQCHWAVIKREGGEAAQVLCLCTKSAPCLSKSEGPNYGYSFFLRPA